MDIAKLRKLVGMLGSAHAGERAAAVRKIAEWLKRHNKTAKDINLLLQTGPVLDLVDHTLREFINVQDHEYTAIALWILHTHVFDQFMHSPRLALLSPASGCGKTTTLNVLNALVREGRKVSNITPAALARLADEGPTILLDEGDNQALDQDKNLMAVLNSGHETGGSIARVRGQHSTFAPLAIAAIGLLPNTLTNRSVVIRVARSDRRDLRRFDKTKIEDLHNLHKRISEWAESVRLDTDPNLPTRLRNRSADNWRPLMAIADAFGSDWGTRARDAANKFAREFSEEDPGVRLLTDIRRVFDMRRVDRLSKTDLLGFVIDANDEWECWAPVPQAYPRPLKAADMSKLLKRFGIRPRTFWPRGPRTKSSCGYLRSQFDQAWKSYCAEPERDTSTQVNNVMGLLTVAA